MKTRTSTPLPASLLALAACLAFALTTAAQTVPALVNYQGRLSNPDGSPLPTADYELSFRVYDAATGGSNVWGPQRFDGVAAQGHGAKIPVVQGYFNVLLGPVDTNGLSLADAFNATNRYVEVTVSNRPPIAPRQQILTTPFAFQAANSAKLAGYDWSAVFGTNNPVAGTIPFSKLGQRQVGTNVAVGGVALSPSIASQVLNNSAPAVAVTNLTVTLQTSGRPVFVGLICDTNGVDRSLVQTASGTAGEIQLRQNAQVIARFLVGSLNPSASLYFPTSSTSTLAFPTAGTWTFSVAAFVDSGSLYFYSVRLVAFEL